MNTFTRTLLLPLLAGAVFASAHAAPMTNSSADYGRIVDAWPGDQSVDLALIAPQGMAVPHVRVYVAPDRRYLG